MFAVEGISTRHSPLKGGHYVARAWMPIVLPRVSVGGRPPRRHLETGYIKIQVELLRGPNQVFREDIARTLPASYHMEEFPPPFCLQGV